MPIWSSKTRVENLEPLRQIGLPGEYDFGGMLSGGEVGYFIDSISHVARIDVDETGNTAGAATDLTIAGSRADGPDRSPVLLSHPGSWLGCDSLRGPCVRFMGHVTDPRG
jgi:serine protease inhibitor